LRKALWLAALFIASGLLTCTIYLIKYDVPDHYYLWLQLQTGLPFALACSLLWVRPARWIPAAVLIDCVIWVAALYIGVYLTFKVYSGVNTLLAGLLGGVGLTLATSLGCRSLLNRRTLLGAAFLGAVAGIPFGFSQGRSSRETMIFLVSFPIWQLAIGMWLHSRYSDIKNL